MANGLTCYSNTLTARCKWWCSTRSSMFMISSARSSMFMISPGVGELGSSPASIRACRIWCLATELPSVKSASWFVWASKNLIHTVVCSIVTNGGRIDHQSMGNGNHVYEECGTIKCRNDKGLGSPSSITYIVIKNTLVLRVYLATQMY